MKSILSLLSLICLFSFTTGDADPISKAERTQLVKQLETTRAALLAATKGLTDEQFTFRPAEGKWSVADCVEHIALSEAGLREWVMETLKSPVDATGQSGMADSTVLRATADRSYKANAPESLQPSNKFQSGLGAVDAFKKERATTIDFAKKTQDDLRHHFMDNPGGGKMDTYQGMLLIAAHSKRHTLQIDEIKADPGFPK